MKNCTIILTFIVMLLVSLWPSAGLQAAGLPPILPVELLGTPAEWSRPEWGREPVQLSSYNATTNRLIIAGMSVIELINPDMLERGPLVKLAVGTAQVSVQSLAVNEQAGQIYAAVLALPTSTTPEIDLFVLDANTLRILRQQKLVSSLTFVHNMIFSNDPAPRLYIYGLESKGADPFTGRTPVVMTLDPANGNLLSRASIVAPDTNASGTAFAYVNGRLFVGLAGNIEVYNTANDMLALQTQVAPSGQRPIYFIPDRTHNRAIGISSQFVSNVGPQLSMQTIDLATLQLGAAIPLPSEVRGLSGFAVSSGNLFLLAETLRPDLQSGNGLYIYDLATLHLVKQTELQHRVYTGQQRLALTTGGTRLIATASDDTLLALDPATGNQIALKVLRPDLHALVYNPKDGQLYASIFNGDSVLVFDPVAKTQRSVAVGRGPGDILVRGGTGRVYIHNQISGTLSFIEPGGTGAQTVQVAAGAARSFGLDATLNRLYVRAGSNLLVVLDATSFQEIQRVTLPADVLGQYDNIIRVSEALHRVYLGRPTGGAAVYDGQSLTRLPDVASAGRSFALSPDGLRMYMTSYCDAKSCGQRTFIVDLTTNQPVATLEEVAGIRAINGKHAYGLGLTAPTSFPLTGYPLYILDTQTFAWVNTGIQASLIAPNYGTTTLYAFSPVDGNFSRITDNLALSYPATAGFLQAKIQILWPHDDAGRQAPTQTATKANLMVTILQPGGFASVGCDWNKPVYLWASRNNEPAYLVGQGTRRIQQSVDRVGQTQRYPVWDFNDVDVRWANDPANKMFFWISAGDVSLTSSIWAHAVNPLTFLPNPQVPSGVGSGVSPAIDARIDIVWPHDAAGHQMGVTDADFVNIGVTLYRAGSRVSVGTDWNAPVRLYQVLNNSPAQLVGNGTMRVVVRNGVQYPIWEFNNVDVRPARDPQNKYYFYVLTDGLTYPAIWVHGADARTLLPVQDTVYGTCP